MNILITLVVAFVGGIIGYKLKIPAGAFIGAMVFAAIYNIITSNGSIPLSFRIAAQIVIGAYVGLNFNKDVIIELKTIILPVIVMVLGLFVACIILGVFISKVTGVDLITAMLGSSPGGLTEMTIIADSYQADTSKVAVMHLIRLVSVVTILPIVIKKVIMIFVK